MLDSQVGRRLVRLLGWISSDSICTYEKKPTYPLQERKSVRCRRFTSANEVNAQMLRGPVGKVSEFFDTVVSSNLSA